MPSSKPGLVLLSTGMSVFAVFLDTSILYVAFPSISAAFPDSTASGLAWVLNAYTVVFAAVLIPAGRIADRIGRRRMFLGAVIAFTAASVLCGVAPSVELLVVGRVLQALGAAAMVPSSLALVLQTFPAPEQPRAIAIWGAIGGVAGAAGPTLGSIVIQTLGWPWVFFINVPVGIASYLLGRRVLPEGRESVRGRIPDPWSIALVIAAVSALSYGVVQTERVGWLSGVLGLSVGVAVVLGAVFVWRSSRIDNAVLDLELLSSAGFRWANLATCVYSAGFGVVFLCNVLFTTEIWDYSVIQAGFAIAIGPAIVAVLAPRFGKLAGRVGQRRILIPGGLVWASAPAYFILMATEHPQYLAHYLPAQVLGAIGVAMVMPQLNSAAVRDLPQDQLGQGAAASQAARNIGTTIGVSVAIAMVAATGGIAGFHHAWTFAIGTGLVVTLLAFLLPRHTRQVEPAVESPTILTDDRR
ncbi:MFS transporter [Cumulibacter soli]|uniref:MFS transporter n=1 Tax=Cumulibacter soli TaxID=2546344 RepID=UPI0010689344|nr:MFS transporter [Cumulibacter soli]